MSMGDALWIGRAHLSLAVSTTSLLWSSLFAALLFLLPRLEGLPAVEENLRGEGEGPNCVLIWLSPSEDGWIIGLFSSSFVKSESSLSSFSSSVSSKWVRRTGIGGIFRSLKLVGVDVEEEQDDVVSGGSWLSGKLGDTKFDMEEECLVVVDNVLHCIAVVYWLSVISEKDKRREG